MRAVDKNGKTIITDTKQVSHKEFLEKIIKPFKEIRVGVGGGKKPFRYIFLKTTKKEIIDAVRSSQMKVTFSIMYNSRVQSHLHDVLYIHKLKTTLLDDKK